MLKFYLINVILVFIGLLYLRTQNQKGTRMVFFEKWVHDNFEYLWFKYRLTSTKLSFRQFCKGLFNKRIVLLTDNPGAIQQIYAKSK